MPTRPRYDAHIRLAALEVAEPHMAAAAADAYRSVGSFPVLIVDNSEVVTAMPDQPGPTTVARLVETRSGSFALSVDLSAPAHDHAAEYLHRLDLAELAGVEFTSPAGLMMAIKACCAHSEGAWSADASLNRRLIDRANTDVLCTDAAEVYFDAIWDGWLPGLSRAQCEQGRQRVLDQLQCTSGTQGQLLQLERIGEQMLEFLASAGRSTHLNQEQVLGYLARAASVWPG